MKKALSSHCVFLDAIVEADRDWHPFFSTDPNATAVEIIEAFADRATIEQDFHDVQEVWGAGQQQVRKLIVPGGLAASRTSLLSACDFLDGFRE
jgi:hypothetical protein